MEINIKLLKEIPSYNLSIYCLLQFWTLWELWSKKLTHEKLSLSAKLLGHPAPKVTWEKDGQVINELTDRLHIFNCENVHNLEIESVNYTDGGVYRIIARNALGRQQAQERGSIRESDLKLSTEFFGYLDLQNEFCLNKLVQKIA